MRRGGHVPLTLRASHQTRQSPQSAMSTPMQARKAWVWLLHRPRRPWRNPQLVQPGSASQCSIQEAQTLLLQRKSLAFWRKAPHLSPQPSLCLRTVPWCSLRAAWIGTAGRRLRQTPCGQKRHSHWNDSSCVLSRLSHHRRHYRRQLLRRMHCSIHSS